MIVAGWVEYDGDQVRRRPDGLPLGRIVVAAAEAWTIHDTWFTTGLAGSGSHDYSVSGLLRDAITMNQHVVAQERMFELVGGLLLGADLTLPFV